MDPNPDADNFDALDEGYDSGEDSDDSEDDDYHDYSTSRSSDGISTSALPATKFSNRDLPSFPPTIDPIRSDPATPMCAYADLVDSDNPARVSLPKGTTCKPGSHGPRGGGTRRGRGGRTGRGSSGRDRSRSPNRTSGTSRSAQVREPTSSEPVEDALEGLGPIAQFNAGIDPDNVPKAGPVPTRKGKLGGSLPGRVLHWWTAAE
jgi:hypothetical protein